MPIYTKTGDKGDTGLATGQRISKASALIDFIGALDEMNALLGMCVASLDETTEYDFSIESEVIESIQSDLFVVGAIAAGAKLQFVSKDEVQNIEETIDDYEKLLPTLKNFILPGGSPAAANIHYARTVARRLERQAVSANSKELNKFVPYLNRLSDLLFVMARFVNFKLRIREVNWSN